MRTKITVVAITHRADGNIKFQILVAKIGLVLAEVPVHTAAAQVRAA